MIAFLNSIIFKIETKFLSVDSALKSFEKIKAKLEKVAEYYDGQQEDAQAAVQKFIFLGERAGKERDRANKALNKIQEFLG